MPINVARSLALATLIASTIGAPARSAESAAEIEAVVRKYYDAMEVMDYDTMRAMSTDSFEILDRGYRYGHYPFWTQVDAGRRANARMSFQMKDFRTVVTDDVAYTSFVTVRPTYRFDGLDLILLKRTNGQWLVDRFVHLQQVNGTDPHRVPGGEKATWEGKPQ